jgi:hypothetical protein
VRRQLSQLVVGNDGDAIAPQSWGEAHVKIVSLYGGTSGPTVGCLNEILDDVRTIYPTQSGSVEVITTESAVLDATSFCSDRPKFSSPGDSGAPVFAQYYPYSMLGMLVDGHRDGYPGSWFTPVVWILDDIQKTVREHLGTVDVLYLGSEP